MKLLIVAGCANPPLAEAIAAALGLTPAKRVVERIADGERQAWR